MAQIKFPIRINRYLALKGLGTRRSADELIKKRRILISGRVALLGDMVGKEDVVEIIKTNRDREKKLYYYAYYKPVGIITPQQGEKNNAIIADKSRPFHGVLNPVERYDADRMVTLRQERRVLNPALSIKGGMKGRDKKLFPIGRLDKDSSGLLILTNDGRITDRLLNPVHEHEKEYIVEVDKKLTPHILRILGQGVDIEGYRTKPSRAIFINDHTFRIILHEGKKHQIRRMVAALGLQVRSLKRLRIMNIELGTLKQDKMREIKGEELRIFLQALGLV